MISTDTTDTTVTTMTGNGRGAFLGAFDGGTAVLAGRRMRAAAGMQTGTGVVADEKSVDHRIAAQLPLFYVGGHVWLRPATDLLVPTTGHLAWSPPI